ncbi:hypothetical protein [Streptomyces sp. NPDC059916]|uniref:hypothetical protein n=1 Tax=Streptomyces sp. NPDC059916 TaxID=3347001 RepID=UPI0036A92DB6
MSTPQIERTVDGREELLAPIGAAVAQLVREWQRLTRAQDTLLRTLERIRPGAGALARIRDAATEFNGQVGEFDRLARAIAERWSAKDLPIAYRDGALRALERAGAPVALFRWTADHQAALTGLTATFYVDLIQRIQEAVRRAQAFLRAAQAASREVAAGRQHTGIDSPRLAADHPLGTVIYANAARHPVKDWARSAFMWQGVVTANHGAINSGRLDLDAAWFECVDGPECGFQSHPDTDHADGTIRSADDAAQFPVAHHGCVAEGTQVESLGALESAYRMTTSGRMICIGTLGGRRITITPNHPVLTGRGWIAASEIQEGDQVVVRSPESRSVPAASYLDQVPALVEDVFAALRTVLPDDRVVAAPHDFHGDGSLVDGEINVVGAQGQLWSVFHPTSVEDSSKLPLQMRDPGSASLARERHLLPLGDGVLATTGGGVSGIHVRRVAGPRSDRDAEFLDSALEGAIHQAEFVREAEDRFAIQVSLDDVVEIGYVNPRGHVYDLSTTGHAYFANGILVHNCIRQWIPRPDLNGRKGLVSGDPV